MSGQPIAVRDVETDARFARDVAESTHYVPTSILAAPLFDEEGEAAGVLSVLDPRVDQSADWTLTVLGTLAALVGLLVEGGEGDAVDDRLAMLGRRVLAAVEELRP
jgi:GAF domain-containing protein